MFCAVEHLDIKEKEVLSTRESQIPTNEKDVTLRETSLNDSTRDVELKRLNAEESSEAHNSKRIKEDTPFLEGTKLKYVVYIDSTNN